MKKCNNCGRDMADGALFCNNCGKPVSLDEEKPEVKEEAPKAEEKPEAKEEAPKAEVKPEAKETQKVSAGKEKKKIGKWIWIANGIALVVLVVVCIFNFAAIKNNFAKLFMSSDDYCQYVLLNQVGEISEGFSLGSEFVQNAIEVGEINQGMTTSLQMTEDAIEDLEELLVLAGEEPENLAFLDDVTLQMEANLNRDCYMCVYKLLADGNSVLTINLLMDQENYLYLQIPELNEQYVAVDLSGEFSDETLMENYWEMLEEYGEIQISSEDLKVLVQKLAESCIVQIEDVEESTDVLTVGDMERRCTVLEFEIDEDLLSDMLVAMVETLTEDESIEEMMEWVEDTEENVDWDEIWEEAEDAAKEVKDDEINLEVALYVDSKGDIIGHEWEETNIDVQFASYFILGFDQFATEVFFGDDSFTALSVEGEGDVAGNEITGALVVEIAEKAEIEVMVQDYLLTNALLGEHKGTIILRMESLWDLLEESGESTESVGDFVKTVLSNDMIVTFDMDFVEQNIYWAFRVEEDGESYFGMENQTQYGEYQEISVPELSDCCNLATDSEEELLESAEEYYEECDFEAFLSALEEADFPESFLEEVEEMIEMLEMSFQE